MKNTKVTVLLPDSFREPQKWNLEIPFTTPANMADLVFHLSNCPPAALSPDHRALVEKFPRTGIRSVSVGDIILINDPDFPEMMIRHVAIVKPFGFDFL